MMRSEASLLIPRKRQWKRLRNVMKIVSALDNGWYNYYIKKKLKINSHSYPAFGKMLQKSNKIIWKACLWKLFKKLAAHFFIGWKSSQIWAILITNKISLLIIYWTESFLYYSETQILFWWSRKFSSVLRIFAGNLLDSWPLNNLCKSTRGRGHLLISEQVP